MSPSKLTITRAGESSLPRRDKSASFGSCDTRQRQDNCGYCLGSIDTSCKIPEAEFSAKASSTCAPSRSTMRYWVFRLNREIIHGCQPVGSASPLLANENGETVSVGESVNTAGFAGGPDAHALSSNTAAKVALNDNFDIKKAQDFLLLQHALIALPTELNNIQICPDLVSYRFVVGYGIMVFQNKQLYRQPKFYLCCIWYLSFFLCSTVQDCALLLVFPILLSKNKKILFLLLPVHQGLK